MVHLLDKGLQLAVQFRIAAGKAVGILRQTMALGTLLRYHITVQCVEHRGGRRRRCFLFLAEQPEKTFPPLFLRLFLPARLHYHRHLLGYPTVDVRLLFQSLHDGAQPLFLVLQQVAHAVYAHRFVMALEAAKHTIHRHPLPPVCRHILIVPFQHRLAQKRQLHHTHIRIVCFLAEAVDFTVLPFQQLQVAPFAEPRADDAAHQQDYKQIACGKQLAEMLGSGNELFAHLLFV